MMVIQVGVCFFVSWLSIYCGKVTPLVLDGVGQVTNTEILSMLVRLESEVVRLESAVSSLQSEVKILKDERLELEGNCGKCSTSLVDSSKPSFMASLTNTVTGCNDNATLLFDNVLLNVGSAYDNKHGVFRAPRNGTYHFGATLSAIPHTSFYVDFVRNSVSDAIGYLYAEQTNIWLERTTSIVVHLNAGDNVWMACGHGGTSSVTGAGKYHSHFSGFLISED